MKSSKKPILSISQILKEDSSDRIKSAYDFAYKTHKGRFRFSGEPYLIHVVEASNILLSWLKPEKTSTDIEDLIISTLLHDSIEYENISPKSIQKKFGTTVKKLVLGVSDLRSDGKSKTEEENLKYIAKKGYFDPRVFVIKLADRLHNMRTHKFLPKVKQIPKAQETMNVYAPLAESMGMWLVKKELEDICFFYLNPKNFFFTKKLITDDPRMSTSFDKKYSKIFNNILGDQNYTITFDKNGLWTIYNKKLKAQNLGLETDLGLLNIDDVKTASIILDTTNDLEIYNLLGKIHTSKLLSKYVEPKKVNDYIARPRPNKYSSIQTILNLPEGMLELNLVTSIRHDFNNWGIINLIRQNQNLESYKQNIIFNEDGHATFMPQKSRYVDYVYKLGIGSYAKKVVVNGKSKNLDQWIRNGSIVKILLSTKKFKQNTKNIAKFLADTQEKIKKEINLEKRNILIKNGRKILEKVLIPIGIFNLNDLSIARNIVINSLLLMDTNELCFRLGVGDIKPEQVSSILEKYNFSKKSLGIYSIRVSGENKPGKLKYVTNLISNLGGDIFHITSPRPLERKPKFFTLRILFKEVKQEAISDLKSSLTKSKVFSKVEIV